MKYDLEETIVGAMMCYEPVIIVEGQDDIKFYSNVASLYNILVDIRAIENIEGYSEGCEKVIAAMEEADQLFKKDNRLKKYALGIIDRDVRQYRKSLPIKDNLLVLKYYSYETHLINNRSLENLLNLMTKASKKMVASKVIEYVRDGFEKANNELYYFSLDALKGSCNPGYTSDVSYDMNPGALIGKGKEYHWEMIIKKKKELDDYAQSMGITKNDLRYIAKGKWYLATWCDYLVHKTQNLYSECGKSIPKCIYCNTRKNEKCLWRPTQHFQFSEIETILNTSNYMDENEVLYISSYMKSVLNC